MSPEKEYSKEQIRSTIYYLRHLSEVEAQDLFGQKKEMNPNVPEYNGTKVLLEKPLERSKSPKSSTVQKLEALLALGSGVLVGLVSASDNKGNTLRYLSLYSGNPNNRRAQYLNAITTGENVTLGRDTFSDKGDVEDFMGVSSEHVVINVDYDGVLTVVDRNSTNGTTLFTTADNNTKDMPFNSKDIRAWAVETSTIDNELQRIAQEKDVLKGTLGKFVLDN